MIQSFRHKGLRRLYEWGDISGIQPAHARKLQLIMAAIDAAPVVTALDIPGFRLHRLKGQLPGAGRSGLMATGA